MSKSKLLNVLLGLALLLPVAAHAQVTYLVNDTFTDADRIGGLDGSSTTSSAPTVSAATATNTQWVVSRVNQMVASSNGLLWTQDVAGSTLALGYFPTVTVTNGAPVTFTLNFTTGAAGGTANNLRIALVDGTASGFRATDGVSTGSDATHVNDVGYGIFSVSSNLGGGNTTDLALRTYERVVTTSSAILSAGGDWGGTIVSGNNTGPLAGSTGATGYLQPNTSYSLQVLLSYDGTTLSITTSLTGGNLSGLTYVATDSVSPTLTFNEIALRFGGGSGQFSNINFTSFTATTPSLVPAAPTATAASAVGSSGFAANWNSAASATGYRLDVATDNAFTSFVSGYQDLDVGNVLTKAITGLSPSTPYYYRVRAYNTDGTSTSSNTITATTTAAFLVNDTWQDATRTDPASPTYAENDGALGTDADADGNVESAWFNVGTGSSLVATAGHLTSTLGSGSQTWTTYFTPAATPVTLARGGDSLTVTWTFTPTGTITSNTNQGFVLALAQTPAASRVSTDSSLPSAIYAGYAMFMNMAPTLGNSNPFQLKEWSLATAGALLGTSANWGTADGNGATTGNHGYDAGTSYTFTMTLTRDVATPSSLDVNVTMVGGTLNNTGTASVSFVDTTPNSFTFDTFAVRPTSAAVSATAFDTTAFQVAFTPAASAPTISSQPLPASQSVSAGASVTYSVTASGTGPFTYQWQKGGVDVVDASGHISGATTATLTITSAQAGDTGNYTVVITNPGGSVTSNVAGLTVAVAGPTIAVQPQSQSALLGTRASLSVFATGTGTLAYQWNKAGTPISGATGASLTLTNLQAGDAVDYTVAVTDNNGTVTSSAATLTLVAPAAALPTQPTIPAGVFKITDYGAIGDGSTDNTTAIQTAINAANTAGGGTIEVPAAAQPYLTGPITLRSNMNLQIDGGAILRALPRTSYPNFATTPADLITFVSSAANIAITGNGTIEGDGAAWWTAYNANNNIDRPRLVQFTKATNVLIGGITLQNSPQFHIAMSGSGGTPNNNVTICGVTVRAPSTSPNTDGIDPTATNILIQKCDIAVGDDNIAIKAQNGNCGNMTVADCTFGVGHGLSVGGQTNFGLDGLTVTNCTFTGTTSGLRLKADATQGGIVQNLSYTGLTMTNVQYPIVFYSYYNQVGTPGATSGSNQTTVAKVLGTNATPPNPLNSSAIPVWKNIAITNLTATGATGYSILWGLPLANGLISGVTFDNVSISGGPGLEIYNATDVQFKGAATVPTLTTANALAITKQPAAASVAAGGAASFTIAAVGASGVNNTAPTYQWKKDGVALVDGTQNNGTILAGATTNTLAITNAQPGSAGAYTCTVSDTLDGYNIGTSSLATDSLAVTSTSSSAAFAVSGLGTVPSITTQPASTSVRLGNDATFSTATTSISGTVTYQWMHGSTALADSAVVIGSTTDTLTLKSVQPADAGIYTVVATNSAGSSTSSDATLTVLVPPAITQQPAGQSLYIGATLTLSVTATGTDPLSYQWKKDGVDLANDSRISGATGATLTITSAQIADTGAYTVFVSNAVDSQLSADAAVTVAPQPTAPLAPVANAATAVDVSSFIVSWNSVATATGYRLDVSTSSSFASYVAGYQDLDVGLTLSRAVANLKALTTYYVRVRAYNAVGASPSSNVINVTTLDSTTAPKITSASSTTFTLGLASTFTVTATGKPAPTLAATGLPSWVTFTPATGLLSGTPPAGTANGQFTINFTATNSVAPDATQVFTLSVQSPPTVTTPMIISTFAGLAGASGSTDATGTLARFNNPADVAADTAGNIFVADTVNHAMRRITPAGVVTLFSGLAGTSGSANGASTVARFNNPTGVAVDTLGNVYVADTLNNTIRKLTSTGTTSLFAGSATASGSADGTGGSSGTSRFNAPQGLALSPDGKLLYVADTNNHTIRQITVATSDVTTLAGLAGQSGSADGVGNGARFNAPSDIAVDKNGNLYVADTDNNAIRTVSPTGAVATLAGLAGSAGAADGTGSAARFNHPGSLVVDSSFAIYVLDTDNHAIRKIVSAAGVVTTVAGQAGSVGSADGTGATARFNYPSGIALSSSGSFYIADTNNHTIRLGTIPGAPVITSQPQGTTVSVGATVQLFVTATGQPEPTYQWLLNGSQISGATTSALSIPTIQVSQGGKYTVVVTNSQGSVTSNEATVTVNAPVDSGGSTGGGSTGAGSGGGGGAPSLWFYLALALLLLRRTTAHRRSAQSHR